MSLPRLSRSLEDRRGLLQRDIDGGLVGEHISHRGCGVMLEGGRSIVIGGGAGTPEGVIAWNRSHVWGTDYIG